MRRYLSTTSDVTLKTALYEDVAATTGVVIAIVGLILLQMTGNPIFDGLASILIGLVLITVAIMLGTETRRLLLGAAAPPDDRRKIREAIAGVPEVGSIVTILTMQLGLDSVLVTGEINLRYGLTTDEIENVMERIERRIREMVPEVRNIYLEPHCRPGEGATPAAQPAHGGGG